MPSQAALKARVASFVAALAVTTLTAALSSAGAETNTAIADLVVNGCGGVVRAAKSVESNSLSKVIAALDQANGAVTLASESSSISAQVFEGKVTFDGVAPGIWELCPQAAVSEVRIVAGSAQSSGTTAAIIGAAGLLAGGAAIGFSDSSGGSSDPARAVVPPSVQVEPDEIAIGTGAHDSNDEIANDGDTKFKPTCPAVEDCLNDEAPEPISPIS